MIHKLLPYVAVFLGALVATLVLTPIVRELNRKLGMRVSGKRGMNILALQC